MLKGFLLLFLDPIHSAIDATINWLRPPTREMGYGGCSAPQKPVPVSLPSSGEFEEAFESFLKNLILTDRNRFERAFHRVWADATPHPGMTPTNITLEQFMRFYGKRVDGFLWNLTNMEGEQ